MHLNSLDIHHFRNYSSQAVTFSPGVNLITGENGQGKTNLLEAIHFCALGFSPRTRKDGDLIGWGADRFTLLGKGEDVRGEDHWQSVQLEKSGKKAVRINGTHHDRFSALFGSFYTVYLSPADGELVSDGPAKRRRYLDTILCQSSPEYLQTLREYQRVVKQRNAYLKNPESYDSEMEGILEGQLLDRAVVLIEERLKALENLAPTAQSLYEQSKGLGKLKIIYRSGDGAVGTYQPGAVRRQLESALSSLRRQEREWGTTLLGPHRDNLLILLSGKKASDYGSQGQKRLIALSLKLAASHFLESQYDKTPILLLDDVFAELDEVRRREVGNLVAKGGQVFLASPRREDLPFHFEKIIRVRAGTVEPDEH